MKLLNWVSNILSKKSVQPQRALGTNISVQVNGAVIDALQNIVINESLSKIEGSCTRVRFNKQRIVEAFAGQTHLTPSHQLFDMKIIETLGTEIKDTTLKNCKILSVGVIHDADNYIVKEYMTFEADSIFTKSLSVQ